MPVVPLQPADVGERRELVAAIRARRGGALRRLAATTAPDPAFAADERAALALTVAMTRDVAVGHATMDAARVALGGDRALVEMVGIVAAYNMVSRFLVALQVEPE